MVLLVQRILFRFVVIRPHKRMIEIKDEIRPRKELARSKEARMKDEEDREGRGRRGVRLVYHEQGRIRLESRIWRGFREGERRKNGGSG